MIQGGLFDCHYARKGPQCGDSELWKLQSLTQVEKKNKGGQNHPHCPSLQHMCLFINKNANEFALFGKVKTIWFTEIKMLFCWFHRKELKQNLQLLTQLCKGDNYFG